MSQDNPTQSVRQAMRDVSACQKQLLAVLKATPEHIGAMAIARLLAVIAMVRGKDLQFVLDGVRFAWNTVEAERRAASATQDAYQKN